MSINEKVQNALLEIPARQDALNQRDDEISNAIHQVETSLRYLRLTVPVFLTVTFAEGEWEREVVLGWSKVNGTWCLSVSETDDDTTTPLLTGGTRGMRAFMTRPDEDGLSPIERLVVETPQALERMLTQERATEPLRRLITALKAVTRL